MLSLVALPVETQLEIFTRCTYESLKQLQVRRRVTATHDSYIFSC
jgi:hypothetical protein